MGLSCAKIRPSIPRRIVTREKSPGPSHGPCASDRTRVRPRDRRRAIAAIDARDVSTRLDRVDRHGEGPRATAKRDVQPVAHAHGRHARPVQGLGVGHGDARQGERGRRGRVLRAAARRDGVVRRSETTTTRCGDATMTRRRRDARKRDG